MEYLGYIVYESLIILSDNFIFCRSSVYYHKMVVDHPSQGMLKALKHAFSNENIFESVYDV